MHLESAADDLKQVETDAERLGRSADIIRRLAEAETDVRAIRNDAIRNLRATGMPIRDIAALGHVSDATVKALTTGSNAVAQPRVDPHIRAFMQDHGRCHDCKQVKAWDMWEAVPLPGGKIATFCYACIELKRPVDALTD